MPYNNPPKPSRSELRPESLIGVSTRKEKKKMAKRLVNLKLQTLRMSGEKED